VDTILLNRLQSNKMSSPDAYLASSNSAIIAVVAPSFVSAFNARVIAVAAISSRLVVCAAKRGVLLHLKNSGC
jgi:hypothetical protein